MTAEFELFEEAAKKPYRVLARAYRPVTFDQLIGQEAMVRILRRAFSLKRVAHGFMLTGVRGTGKTTTARIIARAVNCIGPDGKGGATADPCGVCANCVAILSDRHPDVLEMDAASRTGIDDVREIIEATRYRPMQGRMKVFIIDEVHMLSRNAFNALLKTLEEPPSQVTFIFATTELRKVPVTVLSRCQRFELRRVPLRELAGHFGAIAAKEAAEISADALSIIARAADGSVRDGLSLLEQAIFLGEGGPVGAEMVSDMLGLADRGVVFDLLEAVAAGKPDTALQITGQAHQRGADLGTLLCDVLELIHTVSRLKTIPSLRDDAELPEAERVRGAALADRLATPSLGRMWQMLLKGIAELEIAPDRRAAAEMVLIRLCHVQDLPTPGDLVRRLTDLSDARAVTTEKPAFSPPAAAPALPLAERRSASPSGIAPAVVPASPTSQHRHEATARVLAIDSEPAQIQPPSIAWRSWREVVAFVAGQREPTLHGHLRSSVHLVRFAPPIIELRPQPQAPRDLAHRLTKLLNDASDFRWTIAIVREPGEPTLSEQSDAMVADAKDAARAHPLLQAILTVFPGATIGRMRDTRLDAYGLLPEQLVSPDDRAGDGPPGELEFAPLGAEPAGPDDFAEED